MPSDIFFLFKYLTNKYWLFQNAEQIYSELTPASRCGYHVVNFEKWNHIDFLNAKDVVPYLYQHVIKKVEEIDSGICSPWEDFFYYLLYLIWFVNIWFIFINICIHLVPFRKEIDTMPQEEFYFIIYIRLRITWPPENSFCLTICLSLCWCANITIFLRKRRMKM